MGLFSGIVSAVAGPIIGGIMGKKNAKRERANAIADERVKYVRLREAAELGGFNPLTAMETGGAGGFSNLPSGVAPLASTAILTGAVQGLSEVLASEKEAKMTEDQVRDDLLKISRETTSAGGFGGVVKTSAARAIPAQPGAGQLSPTTEYDPASFTIPWVMDTIRGPFQAGETPAVETDMPENVTRQHVGPVRQSFTRNDGSVFTIPVGPDPEEIAAGVAMEHGDKIWDGIKERWERPGLWPLRRAVMGAEKLSKAGKDVRRAYDEWRVPLLAPPPARKNKSGRTLQSYE